MISKNLLATAPSIQGIKKMIDIFYMVQSTESIKLIQKNEKEWEVYSVKLNKKLDTKVILKNKRYRFEMP